MEQPFNYYRVKLNFAAIGDEGELEVFKEEHLVLATCYTEAEALATKLLELSNSDGGEDIEIVRTKIATVVFNKSFKYDTNLIKPTEDSQGFVEYYFEEAEDTGVGLYSVTVVYITVDEVTGKEKKSSENIYVPANSANDAIENTKKYLAYVGEMRMYNIRNVKFDKAMSVLVHLDKYKSNQEMYDKL